MEDSHVYRDSRPFEPDDSESDIFDFAAAAFLRSRLYFLMDVRE